MGAKNILLIFVALLMIGGAFFLAEYRNKDVEKVAYTATISTTTDTISSELSNLDTDVDGLKDWEEVLLGTDVKKADTDGDGTVDGKEVELQRNPLVKGPKDKKEDAATLAAKAEAELTNTDKLARDFFARYMELRQLGLTTSTSSQNELIGKVLSNGSILSTPKVYTSKDISIKSDSSAVAVKKYGNDVGMVFKLYPLKGKDETVTAKESVDKENPEILKEIDPRIASYKNILTGLKKIQVPEEMSKLHVDLMNAVSNFHFIADSLRHSDVDQIRGLQAVSIYIDSAKFLAGTLVSMQRKMADLDVIFTASDAGSMFIPQ